MKRFAFALSFCAVAMMAWAAAAQAQAPFVLKAAFYGHSTDIIYTKIYKPWIDAINADPSGAVKIEAYPDGALGKSLVAQPQLVLDGVTDIAFIGPAFSPGRFPDDQVLELPALFKSDAEGMKVYRALLESNSLRGYEDYVVICSIMNPHNHLFGRKPMRTLSDLRGMKVRIVGATAGQTVKELGMVPILMSPVEVVEAIGRGTIEATVTVPSALYLFGIDRVTSHDYLIPLGNAPLAIVMNRAKYNAMPPAARAVIDKYGMAWANAHYLKEFEPYNISMIERMKSEKRTVVEPTPDDLETLKKIFVKVTDDWAAKAPRNAKLLAKARAILGQASSK
jgi:TRAP-type C4-dicarboxylate transport system substrate-binding protein